MKINSTVKNNLVSNAAREKMSFGIGDTALIIELLRDGLYSNPIRTLTQEYLCNARDATREACVKSKLPARRTKVTLPTVMDSTLKIRDFGVGIDPARMQDVFIQYGNSTKRSTNEQTGGFGIGAKSAFSYTDSFTITTFVDGISRQYLAHIGESNHGDMEQLGESVTTEPNGTEIQIPIKRQDISAFVHAFYRATLFWKAEERPEILGLHPDEINRYYLDLPKQYIGQGKDWAVLKGDELINFLNRSNDGGRDYNSRLPKVLFVVDGIIYNSTEDFNRLEHMNTFSNFLKESYTTIFFLENGVIQLNANRETIRDSKDTRKTLSEVAGKIIPQITKALKEDVAATVKDFPSLVAAHQKINQLFLQGYEGKFGLYELSVGGRLKCDALINNATITEFEQDHQRNGKTVIRKNVTTQVDINKSLFVMEEEIPGEGVNKIRERVRKYLQDHIQTVTTVYTIKFDSTKANANFEQFLEALQGLNTLRLSQLPLPEKVTVEGKPKVSNKGKICLHYLLPVRGRSSRYGSVDKESRYFLPTEINRETKYLYFSMDAKGVLQTQIERHKLSVFINYLQAHQYQMIAISEQSKKKLEEMKLSNFQKFEDFMPKISKLIPLTDAQKKVLRKTHWINLGQLSMFKEHIKTLADTRLTELLTRDEEIRHGQEEQRPENKIPSELLHLYEEDFKQFKEEAIQASETVDKINKEYPLLTKVRLNNYDDDKKVILKEMVAYMNFKYDQKSETVKPKKKPRVKAEK